MYIFSECAGLIKPVGAGFCGAFGSESIGTTFGGGLADGVGDGTVGAGAGVGDGIVGAGAGVACGEFECGGFVSVDDFSDLYIKFNFSRIFINGVGLRITCFLD